MTTVAMQKLRHWTPVGLRWSSYWVCVCVCVCVLVELPLIWVCHIPSVIPHNPDSMYRTYSSSADGSQNISVNWMHKSTHKPEITIIHLRKKGSRTLWTSIEFPNYTPLRNGQHHCRLQRQYAFECASSHFTVHRYIRTLSKWWRHLWKSTTATSRKIDKVEQ